jgi:hypothetical protein
LGATSTYCPHRAAPQTLHHQPVAIMTKTLNLPAAVAWPPSIDERTAKVLDATPAIVVSGEAIAVGSQIKHFADLAKHGGNLVLVAGNAKVPDDTIKRTRGSSQARADLSQLAIRISDPGSRIMSVPRLSAHITYLLGLGSIRTWSVLFTSATSLFFFHLEKCYTTTM